MGSCFDPMFQVADKKSPNFFGGRNATSVGWMAMDVEGCRSCPWKWSQKNCCTLEMERKKAQMVVVYFWRIMGTVLPCFVLFSVFLFWSYDCILWYITIACHQCVCSCTCCFKHLRKRYFSLYVSHLRGDKTSCKQTSLYIVSDHFFVSFLLKMKQHVNHVDELLPSPKMFQLQTPTINQPKLPSQNMQTRLHHWNKDPNPKNTWKWINTYMMFFRQKIPTSKLPSPSTSRLICGPIGSGKSTLLEALTGTRPALSGNCSRRGGGMTSWFLCTRDWKILNYCMSSSRCTIW